MNTDETQAGKDHEVLLRWLNDHPKCVSWGVGARGSNGSWQWRDGRMNFHSASSLEKAIEMAMMASETVSGKPSCGMCGMPLKAAQQDGDYCETCWGLIEADNPESRYE